MPTTRRNTSNIFAAKDLPECRGPKLQPFQMRDRRIEWLERLDSHQDDLPDGDEEERAYVFKVKIDSKPYALKVFKFFNPIRKRPFWGPVLGYSYPLHEVAWYMDPFFAECRAYGRLMSKNKNIHGKGQRIAVPCFGYIFLSQKEREHLEKEGLDFEEDFLQVRQVRALVKELITEKPGVHNEDLPMILKSIQRMNKLSIYNRDIRSENFLDGMLVDFGRAWTEPHQILDNFSHRTAQTWRLRDSSSFDQMVKDEGLNSNVKALPSRKRGHNLRPKPAKRYK